MKQFLKWGGLAIILAALLLLVGCPVGEDEEDDFTSTDAVDSAAFWDSYDTASSRAIIVSNNTNEKLIAFKGDLDTAYMLGGIPANAKNHGIKKSNLFTKNEDFPMILITEEQYRANKLNLKALKEEPFTRVYVYYNHSGDNGLVYSISSLLGGTRILEINNTSGSLNIEIRENGIFGETIGYAPANQVITKLYLQDGDYYLFPVFKRYNPVRDYLQTIFPKGATGKPWRDYVSLNDSNPHQVLNYNDAIASLELMTTGVAMVNIRNNSSSGVRFLKGDAPVESSTGTFGINASQNKVFNIEMDAVPTGDDDETTYATSQEITNYKVGPPGDEVKIKDEEGNETFTVLTDYMYTVIVTGNVNAGNLKAVIYLDLEGTTNTPVPIKFNGNW